MVKNKKYIIRFLLFLSCLYFIHLVISSVEIFGQYSVVFNTNATRENNEYALTFLEFKDPEAFKMDENNIFYIDYSEVSSLGTGNDKSYYPITIGLSSLRIIQGFENGQNIELREIFVANADWFVSHITEDGFWMVPHDKIFGPHKLVAPWPSAMAQGLGISVLVKAYYLTENIIYLNAARLASQTYSMSILENGFKSDYDGRTIYEEYPIKENPPHILNGYIFSLLGLYDLSKAIDDNKIEKLFLEGVDNVENILEDFDAGFWSYYSLSDVSNVRNHYRLSSPMYQKLHVQQLKALHSITNREKFIEYALIFEKQHDGWFSFIIYPIYAVYKDFTYLYKKLV